MTLSELDRDVSPIHRQMYAKSTQMENSENMEMNQIQNKEVNGTNEKVNDECQSEYENEEEVDVNRGHEDDRIGNEMNNNE